MTTSPFIAAGFAPSVTGSSATPDIDGYVGEFRGYAYHIHPTETPAQWALLMAAMADQSVTVEPYVPPVITAEQAMANLRTERDLLLARCDWTQMPDALSGEAELKQAWAVYRQALRDLPAKTTDASEVVFPAPPS